MTTLRRLRNRAGALLDPRARRFAATRRRLADRHIAGDGLEIGALHRPLPLPRAARVRYVDRMTDIGLREHYPELAGEPLVRVDVVDDGETLASIGDASVDFVIANHFLEHTQSPLDALAAHLRVLRPGGTLYLAVPDKRATFDIDREVTPIEHVVRDQREGPQWSRAEHYADWARHVDRVAPERVDEHAAELMARDYSIHFHVWTPGAFGELLEHARAVEGLPLSVDELVPNGHEVIAIVRKTGA